MSNYKKHDNEMSCHIESQVKFFSPLIFKHHHGR